MPQSSQLSDVKRTLLEKYLRGEAAKPSSGLKAKARQRATTTAPLSLTQEKVWRRELRVSGIPPLYNECVTLRMMGPLNREALEKSFNEVVRRHEIWRTTFETKAGDPVQVVHPAGSVQLPLVDLRQIPSAEREAELIFRISAEVQKPFQLHRSPPLRPNLVRMHDSEYRLYLIAHQIVLDGTSAYQILPSELAVLYKAFSAGKDSPLPDLPIQCADAAYWQRECVSGEWGKQMSYWRKQLGDQRPGLDWPTERPQAPIRRYRGAIRTFVFPKDLSDKVRDLSRRENSTLFLTLLACIAMLLRCYTNQMEIVVGTLVASGRKWIEVMPLLGYFLNPVALRFKFQDKPTLHELLIQARTVVAAAMSNGDVPIEDLAAELRPDRDDRPSPFFTVVTSLQPPTPNLGLDWTVTSMDVESGGSPWDIYFAFIDSGKGIMGRVQYNPDLFDPVTITRILEDLQDVLAAVISNQAIIESADLLSHGVPRKAWKI